MATFATCPDLHRHPSTHLAGLAAISFCAKDNVDDELHGVPPATSYIFGQSQFLKSLSHPNLCEYLDVIKGKRDRVFVIQEHYNNSLGLIRSTQESDEREGVLKGQDLSRTRSWAAQILDGLVYLNTHGVAHRTLTLSNVLLNESGAIKLSNYGLYNMTKGGSLVQFSIGDPHYLSPNTLGQNYTSGLQDYSVDVWSVGVVLTEMFLGESFWRKDRLDLDELISSLFAIRRLSTKSKSWIKGCPESIGLNPVVLSFLQSGKLANQERAGFKENESDLQDFAAFLRECLSLGESNSREAAQMRCHDFFKSYDLAHGISESLTEPTPSLWHEKPYIQSSFLPDYEGEVERLRKAISEGKTLTDDFETDEQATEPRNILSKLPLSQVFYLWKLAGGDVEAQFRRNGRLVGTPAIQLLPKVVQIAESSSGGSREERSSVRDIADLFSDMTCVLPLENLEAEILKSIHEPNKDQFSWDTDYFLFSDPDEMNFLQGTMGENKSKGKDTGSSSNSGEDGFLYPDSMRFTPGTPNGATSKLSSGLATSGALGSAGGLLTGLQPLAQQPTKTRVKVPLSIREKDLGYQYQRLAMFTDLLLQYPASRAEILHHSKIDIPPLLRGKVWAAILGVVGDYQQVYSNFDKYTEKPTDRQIELDVPRCHQYNQLMFSPSGHEKMKRLLKCWVEANEHLVYWQGLDSCCAPFLTLNFNNEALAFSCIQKFLPKYLKDMFLHDNSKVIHEYLAVFRHLLSYHDPELSSHLDHIRFIPQLYAISWFMTLFTHIFPLDKIYHLWDKILVGPSSLPLFVGIAILQQFRPELLRSEFNEAIGIFSESFPEMDIEKCIETALAMCRVTPPSTCWLSYDQESREMRRQLSSGGEGGAGATAGVANGETMPSGQNGSIVNGENPASTNATSNKTSDQQQPQQESSRRSRDLELEKRLSAGLGLGQGPHGGLNWWEEPLSIETMNSELAPRIHRSDFVRLRQQALVIDIRPEPEFRNGHYPLSIHMVAGQLELLVHILKKLKKNYLVVIAGRGESGPEFASSLVREGFQRVALLMGGIDALRIAESSPPSAVSSVVASGTAPLSPSLAATNTTSASSATTPAICSCRAIRQVISVHSKVKEEVVVHKCKTPFVPRSTIRRQAIVRSNTVSQS
ncbi:rab-GTPase-TBC domain-containing protein [Linnemannia elongata]|nr:rab-GTPase-TBC domain-containing protein [Linnemannia elongata]